MKKIIAIAALAVCFAFSGNVQAQSFKFGHINVQQVISLMSEKDSAEVKLKKYGESLSADLEAMQVEFNTKYQAFLQKKDSYTPAIREAKEKELQDMNQRVQEYQQTAQEEFQRMQGEVYKPVLELANNAIKKVAKDNSFTYIFDSGTPGVVYFSETQSTDITAMVKKELKITK